MTIVVTKYVSQGTGEFTISDDCVRATAASVTHIQSYSEEPKYLKPLPAKNFNFLRTPYAKFVPGGTQTENLPTPLRFASARQAAEHYMRCGRNDGTNSRNWIAAAEERRSVPTNASCDAIRMWGPKRLAGVVSKCGLPEVAKIILEQKMNGQRFDLTNFRT